MPDPNAAPDDRAPARPTNPYTEGSRVKERPPGTRFNGRVLAVVNPALVGVRWPDGSEVLTDVVRLVEDPLVEP